MSSSVPLNESRVLRTPVPGLRSDRQLPDALIDSIDDMVGRGRARRNPDGACALEPFRTDSRLGLNVFKVCAVLAAGRHELAAAVAGRAANDNDDVSVAR